MYDANNISINIIAEFVTRIYEEYQKIQILLKNIVTVQSN